MKNYFVVTSRKNRRFLIVFKIGIMTLPAKPNCLGFFFLKIGWSNIFGKVFGHLQWFLLGMFELCCWALNSAKKDTFGSGSGSIIVIFLEITSSDETETLLAWINSSFSDDESFSITVSKFGIFETTNGIGSGPLNWSTCSFWWAGSDWLYEIDESEDKGNAEELVKLPLSLILFSEISFVRLRIKIYFQT